LVRAKRNITMEEKDVVVIGGGPAGYVAAIRASQLGARVAVIEKDKLGGTCLNRGCIPTKTLLRGVELIGLVDEAKNYGINTGEVTVDFTKLMKRRDKTVQMLEIGIHSLMKSNTIEVVKGGGELVSATQVQVKTEKGEKIILKTKKIILAPGSIPASMSIPGADSRGVITTDDALKLHQIPGSIVIIGGGAIGTEFATIFTKLGSKVTLVEMFPQIIPTLDSELALSLEKSLRKDGVQIFNGAQAIRIEDKPNEIKSVVLSTGQEERKCEAQLVLIATGRKPCIKGLGLERIGLLTAVDGIKTNEKMETNIAGIYAAGDATGGILLAHVASAEGMIAAENALGMNSKIDYKVVPRCIYTIPEIGTVGITEKEAKRRGIPVKVGTFPLAANSKALILGERNGFFKMVTHAKSGEILGFHVYGPQATELVAEVALTIHMKGTVHEILSTLHAHPTLYEAIREAALEAKGMPIHKVSREGRLR
jgi:dihydrolipoamide dehydrogenase